MAFVPYIHSPGANPATASGYTHDSTGFLGLLKRKPVVNPVVHPGVDPNNGFYPFNDYYGGLLSKLASMRDLALAGLRTDLENRSKSIQGIVDTARGPLNQNYSTAIQEAAAVNDAVANRLNAQGGAATEDLRSKLASLGQDPTAATADLSKYYSGLGGANYAMDAGDVQRLIGRQAEENTLLNKQPALLRQQMEGELAGNQGNIISDYLEKAFGISGDQAQAKSEYQQAKFDFESDRAKADEATYWDNYWKKQDLLFRRWQTQIASGDKDAANQTKKEIDASKRQSSIDVANIRAQASTTAANTRAAATKTAAQIRAAASKASAAKTTAKQTSNVSKQRAYNAALSAVIDPKTGLIRAGINPTGYNADWTMTRIINETLKSYGINPQSPQGKSVRASIMSQASGRRFARANNTRYHYDPNWVKGAKAAARKKPTKSPTR